jgi:hypothetical protein
VPTTEYNTAADLPPPSPPAKRSFFRPTATARRALSQALLSIARKPASMYRARAARFPRAYPIATPIGLFGNT